MDLSSYKLPPIIKGKDLNKSQRLALEIIEHFKIEKKYQGRWWRVCKLNTEFLEDKFLFCKSRNKPAQYLWRILYPKK